MKNIYFLLTVLPELEYPKKPFLSREELYNWIEWNVSEREREIFHRYRSWKDVENIRHMLLGEPFVEGGILGRNELEEAIRDKIGLSKPVITFLERYPTKEEQLKNFPLLLRTLYYEDAHSGSSLFNKLMAFEERLRLALAYIRSHQRELSATVVSIPSDEQSPLYQALASHHKEFFELEEPFSDLPTLFEAKRYSPFELELALSHWRYENYEILANPALFSFDQVLLYVAQFDLLEHIALLYETQSEPKVEELHNLLNVHHLFEVT